VYSNFELPTAAIMQGVQKDNVLPAKNKLGLVTKFDGLGGNGM
jgi:hypothetical protein